MWKDLALRGLAEMTKMWQTLPMHHVVLIVYPGFELLDAAGPASVFNNANKALVRRGVPEFYRVQLASPGGGSIESSGGVTLETCPIDDIDPDALYVVERRLWTSAGVTTGIDMEHVTPRRPGRAIAPHAREFSQADPASIRAAAAHWR